MWRTHSLFGHSEFADHHPAVHTELNDALPERVRLLGDHLGHSLWGDATHLCNVCHCELQPHEFAAGCCDDKDACCWRALSGRCCW
jgi:hypothetical protein